MFFFSFCYNLHWVKNSMNEIEFACKSFSTRTKVLMYITFPYIACHGKELHCPLTILSLLFEMWWRQLFNACNSAYRLLLVFIASILHMTRNNQLRPTTDYTGQKTRCIEQNELAKVANWIISPISFHQSSLCFVWPTGLHSVTSFCT